MDLDVKSVEAAMNIYSVLAKARCYERVRNLFFSIDKGVTE